MSTSIVNNSQLLPQLLHLEHDKQPEIAIAPPAKARAVPGWWESVLWLLLLFVVSQFVPFFILGFWAAISNGGQATVQAYLLPALFAGQILGVGLGVFAMRLRIGRDWMKAIHLRLPALIPCVLAVLCFPAFRLIGTPLVLLAEYALQVPEVSRQVVMDSTTQYGLWFPLLVLAVGAAVNEELFFRGFLGRGLVGRHGALIGVLLTSILFGVLHINLPQAIFAFVLGCYVHLAYLATRSIWVPILLHFINNAFVVSMGYLMTQLGTTGDFQPAWDSPEVWIGLAITLVLVLVSIVSGWGLYRLRDREEAV